MESRDACEIKLTKPLKFVTGRIDCDSSDEVIDCIDADDIEEYELIVEYLKNLTTPFGFLQHIAGEKVEGLKNEDREDLREQREGDNQYHEQEKEYERQLD